ncbi:MAG: helix-turn-helix transcriptional regulator [Candidatus Muiribacteriota bacterium]|jgi:DNA-binding XRE family transcriptional regulator
MKKKHNIKLNDFEDFLFNQKLKDSSLKNFDQEYEEFKKNINIGNYIKKLRLEAGLTQTELANKINSTKNSISRLENHSNDVKFSTIVKIALALGKEINIYSMFIDKKNYIVSDN